MARVANVGDRGPSELILRPIAAGPAAHERRTRTTAALLLVAMLFLSATGQPVHAEEPFRLPEQITDEVGALDGRLNEVRSALQLLQQRDRVQLWLVFVDSFSGANAQEWADETATLSSLGLNDVLLAVATGDRAYAYSVDESFPLSDAKLAEIATVAVEPALVQNDWAGGAIGAANGISQALNGRPVTAPEIEPGEPAPRAGGGRSWVTWALLGTLALIAVAALVSRRKRTQAPAGSGPGPRAPGDEYEGLSTEDLRKRASAQLVEMDDAVRTSEQELGFAIAQFGEEQTAKFSAALKSAKAELAAAFRLQQRLDDAEPEDEATRRSILIEICRKTEASSDRLDAEAAWFDRLRDLEKRAPEVLGNVEEMTGRLAERIPGAEAALQELSGRYAASAVAAVAGNVEQARERLSFARAQAAAGRAELEAGNSGRAVVAARAAEDASGQARQLLDAIDRLRQDLAEAGRRIEAAVVATQRDLVEARAVEGGEELAAAVSEAELALETARSAAAPEGGQDPLAALRHLEEAGRVLDRALARVRDAEQRKERARVALDQALLAARAQILAAGDFITTRRGAVGREARTRLAEAERHYDRAVALAEPDPVTALNEARTANTLAVQAEQLAEADVDGYMVAGGGPWDGGNGNWGAVLGGILLGSMLGGGGGFGGGGFGLPGGGGRRGGWGGLGPGSFGGMGTRGRRGGGGRF